MNEPLEPIEKPRRPTLFLEAALAGPETLPLPWGTVVAYSRRHPSLEGKNQDAAAVIPFGAGDSLLLVADGMGGTRQGGAAAAVVVRQLVRSLGQDSGESQLRTAILDGIEAANGIVMKDYPSSGATLAAVEISRHTMRPYHAGDSEILVVGQRGKLKFQTVSHSPVGLAVEAGLLNAEEALHHHERHLILNAVGSNEMRIELGAPLELSRRDTVLLASDGLTDNVSVDEIIAHIRKGPLGEGVARLVALAGERMSGADSDGPCKPDDLTVVAYRRTV